MKELPKVTCLHIMLATLDNTAEFGTDGHVHGCPFERWVRPLVEALLAADILDPEAHLDLLGSPDSTPLSLDEDGDIDLKEVFAD